MDAHVEAHTCFVAAGGKLTPKFHMWMHLTVGVCDLGNLRMYATWRDESDNKKLATICRASHGLQWESRVLLSWRDVYAASTRPRLKLKRRHKFPRRRT